MHGEDPFKHINRRLDKIEEKLDKYLSQAEQHKVELNWLKGSLKVALSVVITIITGIIGLLVNILSK